MHWRKRMIDPLVPGSIHILLRAKGECVQFAFGALVNERAVVAAVGLSVAVGLNEVLIDLRTDHFHEIARMSD